MNKTWVLIKKGINYYNVLVKDEILYVGDFLECNLHIVLNIKNKETYQDDIGVSHSGLSYKFRYIIEAIETMLTGYSLVSYKLQFDEIINILKDYEIYYPRRVYVLREVGAVDMCPVVESLEIDGKHILTGEAPACNDYLNQTIKFNDTHIEHYIGNERIYKGIALGAKLLYLWELFIYLIEPMLSDSSIPQKLIDDLKILQTIIDEAHPRSGNLA